MIAGQYIDANNVSHGFLRTADGNFTTFDAPGAGTGAKQGTFLNFFSCLTDLGASTGYYVDANNVYHGFVLNPDGSITTSRLRSQAQAPAKAPLPKATTRRG